MNQPEQVTLIEYRIRKVERYVVTKYTELGIGDKNTAAGVEAKGTYDNADIAYEVAYALCKEDQSRLKWPIDDPRIVFPKHPSQEIADK